MSSQYTNIFDPNFDYDAFINDTGSMPNFDTDSPAGAPMFIDPSATFLNTPENVQSPPADSPYNGLRSPQTTFAAPMHVAGKPTVPQNSMQPRIAESSASPESSSLDSSSDSSGRRKRKSPDSASPAQTFDLGVGSHARKTGGSSRRKETRFDSSDSLTTMQRRQESHGQDATMQRLTKDMSSGIVLGSASNSPKGLRGAGSSMHMQNIRQAATPRSNVEANMQQFHTGSVFDLASSSQGNSPSGADYTSGAVQQLSPAMVQVDYGLFGDNAWSNAAGVDMKMASPAMTMAAAQYNPMAMTVNPTEVGPQNFVAAPHQQGSQSPRLYVGTELHVNKTPAKSRVETQIAIKLTLDPVPPGIHKLHWPTNSVAKAKLLAKEVIPSPDTLELSAMVFCSSAMAKGDNQNRALRMARGEIPTTPAKVVRRSSNGDKKEAEVDPNDPNLPQNGGEVKICDNCIVRERKRANRKKIRKEDDEKVWESYEKDRTVFFNTAEYQVFHAPTPMKEGDGSTPMFSPNALQVDAPMRIGCYCRHMSEKIGFQVVFTMKDWQGRFVAQCMTESILITDDHKTHGPSHSGHDFGLIEQSQFPSGSFNMNDGSSMFGANLPHRGIKSFTDLQSLHREHQANWGTATIGHPGSLSRPASPTSQSGPKKKRKGSSGGPRLPAGLMMTRADQPQGSAIVDPPSLTHSASFPIDTTTFVTEAENGFATTQPAMPGAYITNPPTPNPNVQSLQTPLHQLSTGLEMPNHYYSVPSSAFPSRAPSPISMQRNQLNALVAQQSLPHNTPGAFPAAQVTPDLGQISHNQPTLWEVNPSKGPITGSVKITCLGYHFHPGLEVYFDDVKATGHKLWGENTLTCLLPPRSAAGTVTVTLRDERSQYQLGNMSRSICKGQIPFEYVDDSNNQMMKMFAQLLSYQNQNNSGMDAFEYMQAMMNRGQHPGGKSNAFQGSGTGAGGNTLSGSPDGEQMFQSMFRGLRLSADSNSQNFDLQYSNGRTLLSLAASLGYETLVQELIIHGADVDLADKNGITPLMAAAMNDHIRIVRLLILSGADSTSRDLRGFTASELATSAQVATEARYIRRFARRTSNDAVAKSRQNSNVSNRSMWGLPSSGASSSMFTTDESALDSDEEDGMQRPKSMVRSTRSSRQSRRDSGRVHVEKLEDEVPDLQAVSQKLREMQKAAVDETRTPQSGLALMAAWRDNLAAQIQFFHQTAARTLPNLQLPTLSPINLPSLQEPQFNGWRRLSALVPHRASIGTTSPTANAPDAISENGSEGQGSESTTTAIAPPAYNEIFPQNADMPLDSKPPELLAVTATETTLAGDSIAGSSARAPGPDLVERKPQRAENPSTSVARKRSLRMPLLHLGRHTSQEQVEEIRRMRKESLTCAMEDRHLWYIWFPLLVVLIVCWYFGAQARSVAIYLGGKTLNVMSRSVFGDVVAGGQGEGRITGEV